MMEWYGLNLEYEDFDRLLKKDDLIEEPAPLVRFVEDKKFLGQPPLSDIQLEIVKYNTQVLRPHTLVQIMGEEGIEYYNKYTVNEVICQLGKGCILPNSQVYSTKYGFKTAKELTLAPETHSVVSHTGKIQISTPFNKMGSGRGIRLTTKKGYTIDVYEKHKMMAAPNSSQENMQYWKQGIEGRKLDWCYADELSVGDIVPIKIGLPLPENLVDVDPDIAWWFGAMLGDGGYQTSGNGKQIIFTNATKAVQDKWINIVLSNDETVVRGKSGYGCDRFRVNGKGNVRKGFFSQLLTDYGLDYAAHETKHWSNKFYLFDDDAAAQLLNGLWSTDGWMTIQKRANQTSVQVGIDLTSEEVVRGVHNLLMRLGIVSKFHKQKDIRNNGKAVYRVSILDFENAQKFLRLTGPIVGKETVCMEILNYNSKQKSRLDENEWFWDRIKSIEDLGIQDYYDCLVNEDHSYVAGGFINLQSGKDHMSRISLAYIVYLMHCLRDPIDYYQKASGTYIDLINLAVNAKQAQQVFFEPFKNLFMNSPYFNEQGFEPRTQELHFFSRDVRCFSGHSESEGWEGYDVMVAVLDEVSAFKVDAELSGELRNRGSASQIYNMARASVISRFPEVGKVILLSFPRFRCVSPDSKILKSDLTWVEAKSLSVGDDLVSVTESTQHQQFKKSKITNYEIGQSDMYEVVTTKGSIKVSGNHPFLTYHRSRTNVINTMKKKWKNAEDLEIGDIMPFFEQPWEKDELWIDMYMRGGNVATAEVIEIKNLGVGDVVAIETSEHTYISNGFYSHNSDFIQQKYNEYVELKPPNVWGIKAPTWEVNPHVSREQLEADFLRNPVDAEARFNCNPPMMEDAYFKNPELVRKAFSVLDDPVNDDGTWKEWFNGKDEHPRFIHVDLGFKHDSAAMAMVHISGLKEVKTFSGIETLPVINVEFLKIWEPGPNEEVNFAEIRYIITELNRRFPIAKITFDHWQSIDMVQAMKNMGLNADFETVKKTHYDTFSTAVYDGRVQGYWNETLVEDELLRLKLINNNKVDHTSKGSKDAADAVVGAVYQAIDNVGISQELEIEIWDDNMATHELEDMAELPITPVEPKQRAKEIPSDLQEWLMEMI